LDWSGPGVQPGPGPGPGPTVGRYPTAVSSARLLDAVKHLPCPCRRCPSSMGCRPTDSWTRERVCAYPLGMEGAIVGHTLMILPRPLPPSSQSRRAAILGQDPSLDSATRRKVRQGFLLDKMWKCQGIRRRNSPTRPQMLRRTQVACQWMTLTSSSNNRQP